METTLLSIERGNLKQFRLSSYFQPKNKIRERRENFSKKKKKAAKAHTLFCLLGDCDLVFTIEKIVYSKVRNDSFIEN